MSPSVLSRAAVKASFTADVVREGRAYHERGRVQNLMVGQDGISWTATVQGAKATPYTVKILAPREGGPSPLGKIPVGLSGTCSCPTGRGCKHMAAVCFEILGAQQRRLDAAPSSAHARSGSPPAEARRSRVRAWVTALPSALHEAFHHPQPGRALEPWEEWLDTLENNMAQTQTPLHAPTSERVIYLLDRTEDEAPTSSSPASSSALRARAFVVAPPLATGGRPVPRLLSPVQLVHAQVPGVTTDDKIIGRLMLDVWPSAGRDASADDCEGESMDLLMRHLIATGGCFWGTLDSPPLTLGHSKPAHLGWHLESDASQVPAIVADAPTEGLIVLPTAYPWYVDKAVSVAGPLTFEAPLALVRKFLAGPRLLPGALSSVAERLATKALPGRIDPPRLITPEKRPPARPVPCLRLVAWEPPSSADDDDNPSRAPRRPRPVALAHVDYEGRPVEFEAPLEMLREIKDDRLILRPRVPQLERAFLDRLLRNAPLTAFYAPSLPGPKGRSAYAILSGGPQAERIAWLRFLDSDVPLLRAEGWRVDVDEGVRTHFTALDIATDAPVWEVDLRSQEGSAWWFSLDLGILVEGQRVALLPLLLQALRRLPELSAAAVESLAQSGKLYVDLPDGRTLALPFERVRDILMTLTDARDRALTPQGALTVPLDLAVALSRLETTARMRWLGGERLKTLLDRLQTFTGLETVPPPSGLQATLRAYQCEGLSWLQFLRDYGLGGILADDMGLGKTVQALAHLLVEKEAGRLDRPALIVCPTSLIPNWQDEATKFAPSLNILALHGKDRDARFNDIESADVVLTTYPLLPRDSETLLPILWHMIILDEAQAIKNPTSKATQVVCMMKARHRVCLTGTPIENHLGEIWSHFSFLMPGLLSTYNDFVKRFRVPIEKRQDKERQAILAGRLKPFILRRNKSEVAKELPPKTEILRPIEMEAEQRDLYETLRLQAHETVRQALASKGFDRSRLLILSALLKLRQVCCDPRLLAAPSPNKAVPPSAKLESLMEMVPELIDEGRTILLFSQFTSMLDLMIPELNAAGIPFVQLRGDTTDRKTPVQRFQRGDVPLFLISLKAGGTGLNLTAADTVIHYDPWWNPAVENQATDRAHRIGQDKPVFVYKLITRGTVEERMVDLQHRKRDLAAALLEERSASGPAFEAADLDFLFQEAE